MADIVRLDTWRQQRTPRNQEAQQQPFQLLFFTGVRYERNQPASYPFAAPGLPVKPTSRRKVRKA
jgi:hypothetical protein